MSRALFILKNAIEEAKKELQSIEGKRSCAGYSLVFRRRKNHLNIYKRENGHDYALADDEIDYAVDELIKAMQVRNDRSVKNEWALKATSGVLKRIKRRLDDEHRFISSKYRGVARPSQNPMYRNNLIHKTIRGEFVRSKSEVIIANALHNAKVDYYYEHRLYVPNGGRSFYPDFIIKNSIQGQVIYWEHCGMMNDENYAVRWYARKKELEDMGIVENRNLIVTFDGFNKEIDSKEINEIIGKWFFVH